MIEFRRKVAKIEKVAVPAISTASLGISTANFLTNQKRAKQERKFQDSQVAATERLANALEEESKLHETALASKNFKRKVKNNTKDSYIIGDISNNVIKKFRNKNS